MANSIIGLNATIGCLLTPMIDAPQPHWNTATRMPNAAPIESRFMIAALTGTRTDRNTHISSRKLSATTAPKTHGNRDASFFARSIEIAALPPECTTTPVPFTAGSMTADRRWRTHDAVAAAWGEVVGITVMTAAVREGLGCTGETAATPGSAAMRAARRSTTGR